MEEKKLTDEEIIHNLEEFASDSDMNETGIYAEILDLIHRLQNKIKEQDKEYIELDLECRELRTNLDKELAEHEEFTKKAKEEIERLTRELNDTVSMNEMYIKKVEENAELQKQVDELKKPINGKFKDNNALNKAYKSLEKEFTKRSQRLRELQNKENKEQVIECYGILKGCDMVKQAVKDAAKEIFTELLKEFSKRKSCGNADVVVREMATWKGVEVE